MIGHDDHCARCGEPFHDLDGMLAEPWPAFGFRRPDAYLALTDHERQHHAQATDDLCVIWLGPRPDCFVRVVLSIPVMEEGFSLEYGPWVSVNEVSFDDYIEHFEDPGHGEVYTARLATAIPGYQNLSSVPLQIVSQGMVRPRVVPDSTFGHSLVRDFYEGITRREAELRLRSLLLPAAGP